MASKLFEVMKSLETRGIWFRLHRASTTSAIIVNVTMVGVRVAIVVDEADEVCAYVFQGDESVEIGMDAVRRALDDEQPQSDLGYSFAPFPTHRSYSGDEVVKALYQDVPRTSRIFEVLEALERRGLGYSIERTSPVGILITAQTGRRWVEIDVEVDDATMLAGDALVSGRTALALFRAVVAERRGDEVLAAQEPVRVEDGRNLWKIIGAGGLVTSVGRLGGAIVSFKG